MRIVDQRKEFDYELVTFGDIAQFEVNSMTKYFMVVKAVRQKTFNTDSNNQGYWLLSVNGVEYWSHDAMSHHELCLFLNSKKAIIHHNPMITLE
jgi:hypothetical protein